LTILLPITTASEISATDFAVSASLTPKPTATGKSEYFFMLFTFSDTCLMSMLAAPVTPFRET
jgi:hypothetical protein